MADKAVVDRVFNAIIEQTSEEVGALLDANIVLDEHQTKLLNKNQIFEIKRSRSILSTMKISGDQEGNAFIITAQKDSITLGGTLIMLPPDQIEENQKQRIFGGEAADAFGEVANIIAGVYTSVFLEMYPKKLHFKRTDVNEFIPTKLDPEADLPFPPGVYFYSSCSVKLENRSLEKLEVIVPAHIFGLAPPPETAETVQLEGATTKEEDDAEEIVAAPPSSSPPSAEATPVTEKGPQEPEAEPEAEETNYIELSVVDRVLKAAITQCAEEIGTILDIEIELSTMSTGYVSKEEYFARPGPKSTVTEMEVSGDRAGISYFIADLKDSIYFGGTLVMLPEDELSSRMTSGELDGEIEDAFGEVANIISGGIVQNFAEMFPRKFHVKKGNVEAFTPTKVMIESPKPFPDAEYYSVSVSMDCDTHDLGHLTYLVPVELLHLPPRPEQTSWGASAGDETTQKPQTLETPGKPQSGAASKEKTTLESATTSEKTTPGNSSAQTHTSKSADAKTAPNEEAKEEVVAVVYQDISAAEPYTVILGEFGHKPVPLAAHESFNSLRQNRVCGSLLILSKIDDDAFALIIKIRSETPASQPLIVAGSAWTRSAVLKAVRYGVNDIIPTPASDDEIRAKLQHNLKNSC
ncbi:MAG: hypothetical protein RBR43_03700 [Desulfuromonadaceae bacterium]|nr:hypothetical protein [Desulfuromonas sp.]MDY0184972.1 hypothetical protein [Desulfuromonadaceae bacterium]